MYQWLDLFDLNIILIIIIMIVVAIINMSITLLIIILERTQMIGILKALGTGNFSIQKIFVINASYLILRGLFWGNLIGIGLCLLQQKFKLIELDPTTYYVSAVSIDLNVTHLLLLNLGTIVICTLCLIIPSSLVTRISPVKAIRFD
ncbi:MAG: FtsX-like permease family protein [Owenweeksia sp.]|nr:FtsX-like permease family protein [Owenweeksia sp.]